MSRFFVPSLVLAASCSTTNDPRTEASKYAVDPIPCSRDADCCVVNDDCRTTAYVVASKDATTVASLIASADKSRCTACITPMLQVSCASDHTCRAQKLDLFEPACSAALPTGFRYGDHCGRLDVPAACLPSTLTDGGSTSQEGGTVKSLSIVGCGG